MEPPAPTPVHLAERISLDEFVAARRAFFAASPNYLPAQVKEEEDAARLIASTFETQQWGARVDDELASVGEIYFIDDTAQLESLTTLPKRESQGLATAVTAARACEALERGVALVFAQIEAGNNRSIRLHERAAVVYPYSLGTIQCQLNAQGEREIRFSSEPTMRAADSTRQTDWQSVTWSSFLFRWDGAQWVYVGSGYQTEWLWDRAPDQQFDNVVPFSGNYWRRFSTGERWRVWYTAPGPGYYRVAIWFYWYATSVVPAHPEYVWAGPYCTLPS